MFYVIDANVLCTADGLADHVSPECGMECGAFLRKVQRRHSVVVDGQDLIEGEWRKNLPPGMSVGWGFYLWVRDSRGNLKKRDEVQLTRVSPIDDTLLAEFPQDKRLAGFDADDRKYVAAALVSQHHPPIVNAVDPGYAAFAGPLSDAGVVVRELCPEQLKSGPPGKHSRR